jgi:NAD(P)-dependent dehydrogenase (short-subunit alcohol dehydrogenase family)
LAGKVAIVTGAGSVGEGFGTGKAIAVTLAREGARVVLVDMDQARVTKTLDIIASEGGEATSVVADLAEPSAWNEIVGRGVDQYGGVDVLVSNAALSDPAGILKTSLQSLQAAIGVNLVAPFMLSKAVIPVMIRQGGGSIVYISSVAALRGQGGRGRAAYAATKSAVHGLTVDLADAFGKDGIRVNTLVPGMITTPHRTKLLSEQGLDEASFNLAEKTCLGIEGDSWDLARATLFLAGPDGRYITGTVIPVDGGSVARSH